MLKNIGSNLNNWISSFITNRFYKNVMKFTKIIFASIKMNTKKKKKNLASNPVAYSANI